MLYIKMIEWGDKNEQLAAYKWILTTLEVLLLLKRELVSKLKWYWFFNYNRTVHFRHQCKKTTVLSCHICLINTGVEKCTFKYIRVLTIRCLEVRVSVGIETIVYNFKAHCFIIPDFLPHLPQCLFCFKLGIKQELKKVSLNSIVLRLSE